MPRLRRTFTAQYRVKAAHLVIDDHRGVAEVARELDLNKNLLYTWVRDERRRMAEARQAAARQTDSDGRGPLSAPERAELAQLQAAVARQAKQIAFLEQVSAYFAAAAPQATRLEIIAAACAHHDLTLASELLAVSTSKPPMPYPRPQSKRRTPSSRSSVEVV
jgi:transposase